MSKPRGRLPVAPVSVSSTVLRVPLTSVMSLVSVRPVADPSMGADHAGQKILERNWKYSPAIVEVAKIAPRQTEKRMLMFW